MVSLSQEAYILLATLYGGILIGFIYDLYKIFRSIFRPKKIATMIQDLFFWAVISAVAFYVLIFSNEGDLRLYNFLGFALGAVMYTVFLSSRVIKTLLFILKGIKEFLSDLYNLVVYPFRAVLCLIEVPYAYCKRKTKPVYYKSKKILNFSGKR